jgi:hypothetical protein
MFIPDVGAPPFTSKTHDICVAFRTLGAVSPETALARETLANIDSNALDRLIQRGIIRTASRGSLYLSEDALRQDSTKRYAAMIGFWLFLLAIPLILINLLS